jgi:hypothetical protein
VLPSPIFVCPATCGTRPADLAQYLQYGMALTKLTAQDPEVHQLTAEVSQLLKPQAVLRRAGRSLMSPGRARGPLSPVHNGRIKRAKWSVAPSR